MEHDKQRTEKLLSESVLMPSIRVCSKCRLESPDGQGNTVISEPRLNARAFPLITLGIKKEKKHHLPLGSLEQKLLFFPEGYDSYTFEIAGVFEEIKSPTTSPGLLVAIFRCKKIIISYGEKELQSISLSL